MMAEAVARPTDARGLPRMGRRVVAARALQDPALFARRYLGVSLPPHQVRWVKDAIDAPRLLILAPVGHGKSFAISLVLILMLICRDRNIRIILASKTAQLARDNSRRVAYHLQRNEALRRDYGDFCGADEKWTDGQAQVIRPDKTLRDPTLTAVGMGGMVEGVRANLAILDDVLDIETATSEIERKRAVEWFNSTLIPRLDPGGRMVIIGTPWHTEDLYASLSGRAGYQVIRERAVLDEAAHTVLWPERFTWDHLEAIKADIGSRAFAAKYQAQPMSSEGSLFRAEWFRWVAPMEVPQGGPVYVGVDPALGKTEQADFFAAVAVQKDEATGKVYVIGAYANRGGITASYAGLRALCARVNPQKVIVEDVQFQWTALEQAPELRGLPMVPQSPEGRDKLARIRGTLEAAVEGGRLLFVRGAPGVAELYEEMLNLPDSAHDDRTDALEIAARQFLSGNVDMVILDASGFFGRGRA